jgi:magnesium chelatase accessory protein
MTVDWDLRSLLRDLLHLRPCLLLVVGIRGRTIPSSDARRVKEVLRIARIATLPGLGHLAHGERPEQVAEILRRVAADTAAVAPASA